MLPSVKSLSYHGCCLTLSGGVLGRLLALALVTGNIEGPQSTPFLSIIQINTSQRLPVFDISMVDGIVRSRAYRAFDSTAQNILRLRSPADKLNGASQAHLAVDGFAMYALAVALACGAAGNTWCPSHHARLFSPATEYFENNSFTAVVR
ncbi:hypothetical protein WAI453_001186 [Rhynchosporium graminicola]